MSKEISSPSSGSDPTVNFPYLYQVLYHQKLAGNEILMRSEPLCMTNCLSKCYMINVIVSALDYIP